MNYGLRRRTYGRKYVNEHAEKAKSLAAFPAVDNSAKKTITVL